MTLYVETPFDVRRSRLLVRHERTFASRTAAGDWVDRVDEPNARIVEATRQRADHVVAVSELPGSALW